jgi:hypothetical protein
LPRLSFNQIDSAGEQSTRWALQQIVSVIACFHSPWLVSTDLSLLTILSPNLLISGASDPEESATFNSFAASTLQQQPHAVLVVEYSVSQVAVNTPTTSTELQGDSVILKGLDPLKNRDEGWIWQRKVA